MDAPTGSGDAQGPWIRGRLGLVVGAHAILSRKTWQPLSANAPHSKARCDARVVLEAGDLLGQKRADIHIGLLRQARLVAHAQLTARNPTTATRPEL